MVKLVRVNEPITPLGEACNEPITPHGEACNEPIKPHGEACNEPINCLLSFSSLSLLGSPLFC